MDQPELYEQYLRRRITELRVQKEISEHRMSLELGKSGSYIRSITSGTALPSVRELFNIIRYFDMTPSAFFAGLEDTSTLRYALGQKLLELDEESLDKVATFISWIQK